MLTRCKNGSNFEKLSLFCFWLVVSVPTANKVFLFHPVDYSIYLSWLENLVF